MGHDIHYRDIIGVGKTELVHSSSFLEDCHVVWTELQVWIGISVIERPGIRFFRTVLVLLVRGAALASTH